MRSAPLCLALAGALLAGAGGCSQEVQPPPVRNFDRPTSLSFACFGDLRITEGDPDATDARTERTAQPLASCRAHAEGEEPPGQEGLIAPELYSFILQTARGTVAVLNVPTAAVLDSDPLTPGKNDIPVGSLPVGLVSDRSSCFAVTANAGSCDLSTIDVTSALDFTRSASVVRTPVTDASGTILRSKPRAIAAPPQTDEIGFSCPEEPEGIAYVAYPSCDLVAAIDLASGSFAGGVVLRDDGTTELATEADLAACPVECGDGALARPLGGELPDGGVEDAGPGDGGDGGVDGEPPGRPVVLELHRTEGGPTRLFIGSEQSPTLTIVELGADFLPTGVTDQVTVEGDVGLRKIDVSDRIEMGGDVGTLTPTAGEFQFVYAVATDNTVRVIDLDRLVECDTQVDVRLLQGERDLAFLQCMPVGDPRTPARRVGARSPGIHFAGVPTDVSIVTIEQPPQGIDVDVPHPTVMVGTFAFVSAANGFVWVVNVDDDNYPDLEDPSDPLRVFLSLALPHTVRDFVAGRDAVTNACATPSPDPFEFGPRLAGAPSQFVASSQVAQEKLHEMPFLRGVTCEAEDSEGGAIRLPVTELSFAAPAAVREGSYPDLRSVQNENWFLIWEGAVSIDSSDVAIDGPPVRKAVFGAGAGGFAADDPSGSFCAMGVEEHDLLALVGCDPQRGAAQCGVGEVCYVHPDSPSAVTNGLCLPKARVDELAAACRDVLTARRHYTVHEVSAGRLELGERARVLRTTPLDGCVSDAQCGELAEVDRELARPEHPLVLEGEDTGEGAFTWSCQPDPTRAPGPDRCVMTCDVDDDCEEGFLCGGDGTCVAGLVPPPSCELGVQRYQARVGEAFALVGDRTGFLHDRVRDPDTGACVSDPDASPLAVGRVPLRPPPCDGDGDPSTGPNPCMVVIDHAEEFTPFEVSGGVCQARAQELRVRDTEAVRVENPAFRFHLVDTETTGDAECRNDQAGDLPPFATVYTGYQIAFEITGAFFPMFVGGIEAAFPVELEVGPNGRVWVLDQGDATSSTRGRVFVLDPDDAATGFSVLTIL